MNKTIISTVLGAVILLSFCSACTPKSKTVELTIKDQDTEIALEKGDLIKVSLEGNPTTGYQWEFVSADAPFLTQKGDPEYKADSDLIGSGGVSTFTFEATDTGSGKLHLIYHRSFEPNVAPAKEFSASVQVK